MAGLRYGGGLGDRRPGRTSGTVGKSDDFRDETVQRKKNDDDLIVGMIGGTLVPIVGIVLGATLIRRGDGRGLAPLIWCLPLGIPPTWCLFLGADLVISALD